MVHLSRVNESRAPTPTLAPTPAHQDFADRNANFWSVHPPTQWFLVRIMEPNYGFSTGSVIFF